MKQTPFILEILRYCFTAIMYVSFSTLIAGTYLANRYLSPVAIFHNIILINVIITLLKYPYTQYKTAGYKLQITSNTLFTIVALIIAIITLTGKPGDFESYAEQTSKDYVRIIQEEGVTEESTLSSIYSVVVPSRFVLIGHYNLECAEKLLDDETLSDNQKEEYESLVKVRLMENRAIANNIILHYGLLYFIGLFMYFVAKMFTPKVFYEKVLVPKKHLVTKFIYIDMNSKDKRE